MGAYALGTGMSTRLGSRPMSKLRLSPQNDKRTISKPLGSLEVRRNGLLDVAERIKKLLTAEYRRGAVGAREKSELSDLHAGGARRSKRAGVQIGCKTTWTWPAL